MGHIGDELLPHLLKFSEIRYIPKHSYGTNNAPVFRLHWNTGNSYRLVSAWVELDFLTQGDFLSHGFVK